MGSRFKNKRQREDNGCFSGSGSSDWPPHRLGKLLTLPRGQDLSPAVSYLLLKSTSMMIIIGPMELWHRMRLVESPNVNILGRGAQPLHRSHSWVTQVSAKHCEPVQHAVSSSPIMLSLISLMTKLQLSSDSTPIQSMLSLVNRVHLPKCLYSSSHLLGSGTIQIN